MGIGINNDDAAIVGFRYKCKTIDETQEEIIELDPFPTVGNWKNWSNYAAEKFVNEARARVDSSDPLNFLIDHSGLNGIEFWNCPIAGAMSYAVDDEDMTEIIWKLYITNSIKDI